jgi:hypothetical protein
MAYFSPKKAIERDSSKLGVVDGNQVYDIIQETTDYFREFHATEPAIVNKVYINPTEDNFPKTSIGGNEIPDYSKYGTIDASFVMGIENLPSYIKPISNHIVTYPLKGEVVNITQYGGDYYYDRSPLNLNQDVNMNRSLGERGDGSVSPQRTKFNRRVYASSGDTVIQGRFGNSIKLGSDSLYESPNIKIVCGQSQKLSNLQLKNLDPKFIHVEDLNNDGSSIYMTSGPDHIPLKTALNTPNFPNDNNLFGNMIILNSDRLVLQAKGQADESSSLLGCIHILAGDDIIISAGDKIVVESKKIYLGADSDVDPSPLAKGDDVVESLTDIVSAIKGVISVLEDDYWDGEFNMVRRQLNAIEEYLPDIKSRTAFTNFE